MIIIIMGVTGAGKTTVGRRLAADLGWAFEDADRYHSASNIEKMRRGIPLTEEDRAPWLDRLAAAVRARLDADEDAVIACSALRAAYRDRLLLDRGRMRLVYLRAPAALILGRLAARRDHFMAPALIESQFAALEEPSEALTVDAGLPIEAAVHAIRSGLGL